MKPWRIFTFFAAVALALFLLSIVFPGEGIPLTGDLRLRFMEISDLKKDSPAENKQREVEVLVAASTVTDDPEAGFIPAEVDVDSLPVPEKYIDPANADSLKRAVRNILFPPGEPRLLDPFFGKLAGLADGSIARTRILHFGDSQIEMDRMTALIRYRLQRQFGGSGTGLVQAVPLYAGRHLAYDQEVEGEWRRYTFFGTRDSTISHNSYGIMGAFTSVPIPKEGDWPAIHYAFNTSRRTGRFDRARVFLHSYRDGGAMALVVNDTIADTVRAIPAGFSVADYTHHSRIERLTMEMGLPEGGRIYGISFETYRGLQMDNIAMRGGSGLIFTKMNRELQIRLMEYLKPGLLVLQYGGNVVPYVNAAWYRRAFKRELIFLHDICPGVPVIVIGPSDMSLKEKGEFVTYPGVEKVRDALKEAALETGCAFWDLYEAMGGRNSMPSFVHADPPLASTDYVHFTALGVNLVAEMFYNALMAEYAAYLTKYN